MALPRADAPPASNGSTSPTTRNPKIGPHPGYIKSSKQYTPEDRIRHLLTASGSDLAREDTNRLQGVQLIDVVRQQLQLPVRTFDTACVYFHHFRLNFRDAEYNYQDAALASLFVACKVEDTIKKSKEILAAAYNVKNPDKPVAPDDKIFESPGKVIIGLERLILETVGFDFRTRCPQKLLVKVIRRLVDRHEPSSTELFTAAYDMSIDMYKTFVPVKRTTFSMVMAVAELTTRLLYPAAGPRLEALTAFARDKRHHYSRSAVMESMLDLLDLYVQHPKSTKLGTRFDIALFMDIKIQLNQQLEADALPRHAAPRCSRCDTSSSDPLPTPRTHDATMRFVFDPEAARHESSVVSSFFNEQFEEYEIEVDEPVPPPPSSRPSGPRRDDRDMRGGRGGGRRQRDRQDHRWDGPYGGPGGGGGYRGDRHRDHGNRGRGRYR